MKVYTGTNLRSSFPLSPQLNQSAILNRFIQCIRLPEPDVDLHPGVRCQVSGWGDISNYRTVPSQLMEVNTTVVNREVCNASWVGHVYSCMICAANPKPTLSGFCTVSHWSGAQASIWGICRFCKSEFLESRYSKSNLNVFRLNGLLLSGPANN